MKDNNTITELHNTITKLAQEKSITPITAISQRYGATICESCGSGDIVTVVCIETHTKPYCNDCNASYDRNAQIEKYKHAMYEEALNERKQNGRSSKYNQTMMSVHGQYGIPNVNAAYGQSIGPTITNKDA